MLTKEIWKPIPIAKDYYVSSQGRVISEKQTKPKLVKTYINKRGYVGVILRKEPGKKKHYLIHQLVAMAFLDHKLSGKMDLVVDHINSDQQDNRVENLRILSSQDNVRRGIEKSKKGLPRGVYPGGKNTFRAKYSKIYLGAFPTPEEAHQAYLKERKKREKNN
jgi:hypothetical protein